MKRLLIVGAGGHGRVVADAAASGGDWDTICFVDDRWPALADSGQWQVVSTPNMLLERAVDTGEAIVVAIGRAEIRQDWTARLERAGYPVATVVHASAVISRSARVGRGTVVCAGAVLNPDSRIGEAVIVNTRAVVEHDCVIGAGAHVCPGVQMAGGVKVGEGAWIGIGSTIVQGCTVGARATVGAGAVVIDDVPDGCTVAGVPAKQLRPT